MTNRCIAFVPRSSSIAMSAEGQFGEDPSRRLRCHRHQVSVHGFKFRRRKNSARQNALAEPGAKRSTCSSSFFGMSTFDPLGTWQYAHAVCLVAGAREGSNKLG